MITHLMKFRKQRGLCMKGGRPSSPPDEVPVGCRFALKALRSASGVYGDLSEGRVPRWFETWNHFWQSEGVSLVWVHVSPSWEIPCVEDKEDNVQLLNEVSLPEPPCVASILFIHLNGTGKKSLIWKLFISITEKEPPMICFYGRRELTELCISF